MAHLRVQYKYCVQVTALHAVVKVLRHFPQEAVPFPQDFTVFFIPPVNIVSGPKTASVWSRHSSEPRKHIFLVSR